MFRVITYLWIKPSLRFNLFHCAIYAISKLDYKESKQWQSGYEKSEPKKDIAQACMSLGNDLFIFELLINLF